MKKKDLIWVFASIVLLSVVALLIVLPRNTKDSDDILAPNTTGSFEEMHVFPKQDSGEVLAENVFGKRVQTTEEEKAGIEADMQEIGKLCRADYLQAEKIPSEFFGQEKIGQEAIDAMEATLSSAGYCVENSDAVFPNYLENAENLNRFWDDVAKKRCGDNGLGHLSKRFGLLPCVPVCRRKRLLPSRLGRMGRYRFAAAHLS